MTVPERHELIAMLENKSYTPGEMIQAEGESFQHIWIVLKGRCQVVKKTKLGEDKELTVLEPCGVFGEMSFFNPGPHSASVRALTLTLTVKKRFFEPLFVWPASTVKRT